MGTKPPKMDNEKKRKITVFSLSPEKVDGKTNLGAEMENRRKKIKDMINPTQTHPGGAKQPSNTSTEVVEAEEPIATTNRFKNLHVEETKMQIDDSESTKIKPPPIVLQGLIDDHNQTVKRIAERIGNKSFHIRYGRESSNIYTNKLEDHKKLKEYFLNLGQKFHSYTLKNEKTHAHVLKGLNSNIEIPEIIDELKNIYEIDVKDIYKMRGTRNPMFLVITSSQVTLKQLKREVRTLCYTVIHWERQYRTKQMTICKRCQQWGHARSNCYRAYKCLLCADEHATAECTKPAGEKDKCANCRGEHRANSVECEVYQRILQSRISRNQPQPTRKSTYVEAPLPAVNVWEERRKKINEIRSSQPDAARTNTDNLNMGNTAQSPLLDLKNEMDKLNQHININKFLLEIRALNQKMDKCTNFKEKFLIFNDFLENLPSHGF